MLVFVLAFGLAFIGCEDLTGDMDTKLPDPVGTNEVEGKTVYTNQNTKTVLAGSSFEAFSWDWDGSKWATEATGSYSYNSDAKTITIAVEKVMMENASGNRVLMNRSQAKNAVSAELDKEMADMKTQYGQPWVFIADMFGLIDWDDFNEWFEVDPESPLDEWEQRDLAEIPYIKAHESTIRPVVEASLSLMGVSITNWDQLFNFVAQMAGLENFNQLKNYMISEVDRVFEPITYAYQFVGGNDSPILLQKVLPANKGTNQLGGQTFSRWSDEYVFNSNGTYQKKDSMTVVEEGTYAYDSTKSNNPRANGTVWLRPTKIDGKTMIQYYENASANSSHISNANDDKAAYTNQEFEAYSYSYIIQSKELEEDGLDM